MGRKKIYKTEEELKEANKLKGRKYYARNREKCRKERMERYWKIKCETQRKNTSNI